MGGILLPTSVAAASQWQLVDWLEVEEQSAPAAGGLATIQLEPLGTDELWLIDHMVASCTSTSATALRLYVDDVRPLRLRDGSDRGNFDVADWPAGLLVRPSRSLIAQWSPASVGAIGTLTLQARLFRRA